MSHRNFVGLALLALVLSTNATRANEAERTIYLTFDDGPLSGTSNILDVVTEENVPVTMFMVGLHAETSSWQHALVERAKETPFVTVGNHSYSHAYNQYRNFYSDTDVVVADMLKANTVLGLKPWVYARLPGRDVFRLINYSKDESSMDPAQHQQEEIDYDYVAAMKFLIYGWDFEWVHSSDGKPVQSVDVLVEEIDNLFSYDRFTKPHSMVLLMHDEMFQDRFDGKNNLRALIGQLRQRGYLFGAIQHYDPNPYTGIGGESTTR